MRELSRAASSTRIVGRTDSIFTAGSQSPQQAAAKHSHIRVSVTPGCAGAIKRSSPDGAGANHTHRPRWSYLASYFPADARYNGMPNHDTDGFGLKKGYAIDHPSFRIVAE